MTALVAYLMSHGFSPIKVVPVHSGAYRAMRAVCTHHHQLTAWAVYGSHAVVYCYR